MNSNEQFHSDSCESVENIDEMRKITRTTGIESWPIHGSELRTFAKIPDLKKIIAKSEPFKVSAYKTTVEGRRLWQEKSEHNQETIPQDKELLGKLGLKESDEILFIAGYYGDWANAIASAGCQTDYSELSKSIVEFAKNKFGGNKNIRKFICANFVEIPKEKNQYDWTVSFEPVAISWSLPISIMRSLQNKKGVKIIIYPRNSHSKEKYTGLKLIADIYGCDYSEEEVFIDAIHHDFKKVEGKHVIITFSTNEQARVKVQKDTAALENNQYDDDTLVRLAKISAIIKEEFLMEKK